MALLMTGKKFVRDLESSGALAVRAPLEGGFEGRYQRRLRAAGYETANLTVKGLGDLSAYLTDVHGVRPAHLGKKTVGQSAAVGYRYYIPPVINYRLEHLPAKSHVALGCQDAGYLVDTEVAGDGWRADVLAEKNENRGAFEIQWSLCFPLPCSPIHVRLRLPLWISGERHEFLSCCGLVVSSDVASQRQPDR